MDLIVVGPRFISYFVVFYLERFITCTSFKYSEITGTSPSSIQSMGTGTMKWNINKVFFIFLIYSKQFKFHLKDICNRNTLEAFDTIMTVCNVS